jgi:4-hydroxy-3-methylbut-2-en-1-yl diphosphate reductase
VKVILANPRGFCAGVNMAVDSLDKALELFGAPIYVFHEIVHNRHVVENFREKGAIFVETVEEVPSGAILLYSAHGVSPEIRRKTETGSIRAIDATCPLVTKVHTEAKQFAARGFTIVLIGHAGHDEVLGTMGEAPGSMILVENLQDVERLEFAPATPLAFLTQTTLSVDDTRVMIEALKAKFPGIEGPKKDDICYATQNRQEAVKLLSREADIVLVLGSQNSSNSQRLAEMARLTGRPAYLIDSADHIDRSWFEDTQTVLVTAGASAPEKVVQGCVEFLKREFNAQVESRSVRQESVTFGLPKQLRTPTAAPAQL